MLELRVAKQDIGKVIGREGPHSQGSGTILSAVSTKASGRFWKLSSKSLEIGRQGLLPKAKACSSGPCGQSIQYDGIMNGLYGCDTIRAVFHRPPRAPGRYLFPDAGRLISPQGSVRSCRPAVTAVNTD